MAKRLSKKQKALIDELFAGNDEADVLERLNISPLQYKKWLAEADFAEVMEFRIGSALRQSRLIIAKFAPVAAAKLVALTDSENQETARKACLDLISAGKSSDSGKGGNGKSRGLDNRSGADETDDAFLPKLDEATAKRILKALTE